MLMKHTGIVQASHRMEVVLTPHMTNHTSTHTNTTVQTSMSTSGTTLHLGGLHVRMKCAHLHHHMIVLMSRTWQQQNLQLAVVTTMLHTTGIAAHCLQMETVQLRMIYLTQIVILTTQQTTMSTNGITTHLHGLDVPIHTAHLLHLLTVLMSHTWQQQIQQLVATTTLHITGTVLHCLQMETDQHPMITLTRTHTATIHRTQMSISGIMLYQHGLHAIMYTAHLHPLLIVHTYHIYRFRILQVIVTGIVLRWTRMDLIRAHHMTLPTVTHIAMTLFILMSTSGTTLHLPGRLVATPTAQMIQIFWPKILKPTLHQRLNLTSHRHQEPQDTWRLD